MNNRTLLSATLLVACACASAQSVSKPNTFWILGPFGVEHQLGASARPSTVGLYLASVVKNDSGSSNGLSLGLAAEYMIYSAPNASGFGLGARINFADGVSAGPSIAYVTRPARGGVAFRIAASFPFGSDAIPFVPELGIGFRF